jgi:protein-tyrosine-phosphatase/DNA-binding transcriptional ArsR family regulator
VSLADRAQRHAALGDATRLAVVDELATSDRSPIELQQRLGIPSNLLAHHLDVLEGVGLIARSRSTGDGRRRYVHLVFEALEGLTPGGRRAPCPAVFVCSRNSARSQLAAALWTRLTAEPADSAGTHPADRVHPGAVAAARRAGVDISEATPKLLTAEHREAPLVVTVCDRAHEELDAEQTWLHWSIPDPVQTPSRVSFDATVGELRSRITGLVAEP